MKEGRASTDDRMELSVETAMFRGGVLGIGGETTYNSSIHTLNTTTEEGSGQFHTNLHRASIMR
jgi:hypothetical protein